MGFIYISVVVLGITTVAYLAKLSARRGVSSFDFSFVMFFAASILGYCFAEFYKVKIQHYTLALCSISAMAGIGGAAAVFLFNQAVRMGHFGYSNAIYRSSFLLPILFSVVVFSSPLDIAIFTGILFIVASLFLISWSNDAFTDVKINNTGLWLIFILCAFALSGLPRIGQLLISQYKLNAFAYLFLSYAAGFILLSLLFLFRRKRLQTWAFLYGSLAAIASFLGVYCTIEALKLLPAAIVFPITLSVPIMLGMFISMLHREKITFAGWIGVLLGIGGILLLSFQTYAK